MKENASTFIKDIIYFDDPIKADLETSEFNEYYYNKYQMCKEFNPTKIAEIGVRTGYSAWAFLQACPNATYLGIDANNGMHGGEGGEDGNYLKWAKRILQGYDVHLFEADTQKYRSLLNLSKKFHGIDFFHVDGDHTINGVMHDLDLAYRATKNNGIILIDDIAFILPVRSGVARWIAEHEGVVKYEYRESMRGEMLLHKIGG